jgi:hypothetical protein
MGRATGEQLKSWQSGARQLGSHYSATADSRIKYGGNNMKHETHLHMQNGRLNGYQTYR